MLNRTLLSACVALAPALPAAALARNGGAAAPTLVPSLGAQGALIPALSVGSQTSLRASSLEISAAPAFAWLATLPIPVLPVAAPVAPAQPNASAAASFPVPAVNPLAVRSLQALSSGRNDGLSEAAHVYDGALTDADAPVVDVFGAKPSIPLGVSKVQVAPLDDRSAVGRVIPRIGTNIDLHDKLSQQLPFLRPLEAFIYRDGRGGSFVGLDLSKRPENVEKIPGLQPHEIAAIKKIQAITKDLQVLVREEGRTPDLVVGGVVTELKRVQAYESDRVSFKLIRANDQLLAHARRHGLGRGAVVLDVLDVKKAVPERVEAEIEEAVKAVPEVGFERVYVFAGSELKTYSRGRDGSFRLDRTARPFTTAAAQDLVPSFVPSALAGASLPEMATIIREIREPSRRLHAHGISATVTVYGSARIQSPEAAKAGLDKAVAEIGRHPKDAEGKRRLAAALNNIQTSKYYRIAREFGALVAKAGRGKIAVISGGGPGIMEAANRGAFEAGGPSVGYNITLTSEQNPNPYTTPGLGFTFEHFVTRKMSLRYGSMGLVYFPGGFGTLDELFEVLTLIHRGKMKRVPIVLVGQKSYWDKILDFDELADKGLIALDDLSLFTFAETADQAWRAIVSAHTSAARP